MLETLRRAGARFRERLSSYPDHSTKIDSILDIILDENEYGKTAEAFRRELNSQKPADQQRTQLQRIVMKESYFEIERRVERNRATLPAELQGREQYVAYVIAAFGVNPYVQSQGVLQGINQIVRTIPVEVLGETPREEIEEPEATSKAREVAGAMKRLGFIGEKLLDAIGIRTLYLTNRTDAVLE